MTETIEYISDDFLRSSRIYSLPGHTPLTIRQCAMVLVSVSEATLKRRRLAKPPQRPFTVVRTVKGGAVYYPLAEVLAVRHTTGGDAPLPPMPTEHPNFDTFVQKGLPEQRWPVGFSSTSGQPMDFVEALATNRDDAPEPRPACWMSHRELMAEIGAWAGAMAAASSERALQARVPDAAVAAPADGLCPKNCGRPAHPGRACRL